MGMDQKVFSYYINDEVTIQARGERVAHGEHGRRNLHPFHSDEEE